jgi:CPA1 family monovalent cation:H+ antiporter
MIDQVYQQYDHWYKTACTRLDRTAHEFPEFVQSVQQNLAERMALLTERSYIDAQTSHGTLPASFGARMEEEIENRLHQVRQREAAKLEIEPTELLRKVSFFKEMGEEEFDFVADKLIAHTVNEQDVIIRQDDTGKSLFLISRGVVRVTKEEEGISRDVSSLFAGDFFGEMALLHGERRTATVRAVTPCYLYELKRDALEETMKKYPHIRRALEEMDRKRKRELQGGDT